MAEWKIFTGDQNEWNSHLKTLNFVSLYQSYEWGEIKAQDGWKVFRFIKKKGPSLGMAQVFLKKLPFDVAFFWCPGGILGDRSQFQLSDFKKEIGFRFFYFRCSFHDPQINSKDLIQEGWRKPRYSINSSLSMNLRLSPPIENLRKNLSSNWRHNLKRFEKKPIQIERWTNPEARLLYESYQKFESLKGLPSQHSFKSIDGVIRFYRDQLVIFRALDENNHLLALRGYIFAGSKALDWYAISTQEGRKCYASHGVFWRTLMDAKEREILNYDLSGVDPETNPGVYNFKKGTGADLISYPGEFEKASFNWLAKGLNVAMRRKLQS